MRKIIALLAVVAMTGFGVVSVSSPAEAHVGDIDVTAVCLDADTVAATYTVGWTNGTATGKLYQRSGLHGQTGNAGNGIGGWTFVKNVSGAAGDETFTINHDRSAFSGTNDSNGPWWSSKVVFSDNYGVAADTRIEGFDWSTCAPDTSDGKIELCHATGSQTNPFTKIEVSKAAFYVGHREHGGDIYPAGSYEKGGQSYSWPAQGDQSLLQYADCVKPVTHNPPGQSIDCTQIWRDFGRSLVNGDHINVTIKRQDGSEFQINVYVDRNIAGGYDTLGFRYSDGTTRALTQAEVEAGRIWLDVSSKVNLTYYEIKFVQINDSENWPDKVCGTYDECPQLSGDQPAGFDCDKQPTFEPKSDDRMTCETGVEHREWKLKTTYVFENGAWVAQTPVVVDDTGWQFVRALTNAEKVQLGCTYPDQPPPTFRDVPGGSESCELGGTSSWVDRYTTPKVFNTTTWAWEDGAETGPVRTDNPFVPYTDDEYFEECAPPEPDEKVTYSEWVDGTWNCGDTTTTQTRHKTVITSVWDAEDRVWVDNDPITTSEVQTRDLTEAEIDATCEKPEPIVTGTSLTSLDCDTETQITDHTKTTTTPVQLDNGTWVMGEPVVEKWVTAVALEGDALQECEPKKPNPPKEPPTKPEPPKEDTPPGVPTQVAAGMTGDTNDQSWLWIGAFATFLLTLGGTAAARMHSRRGTEG